MFQKTPAMAKTPGPAREASGVRHGWIGAGMESGGNAGCNPPESFGPSDRYKPPGERSTERRKDPARNMLAGHFFKERNPMKRKYLKWKPASRWMSRSP